MTELVKSTDSILRKASQLVEKSAFDYNSAELAPIATLLINAMQEHNGLGISACQVGVDLAMFAMETDDQIRICINPEIVAVVTEMETVEEGCLSFPGLRLKISRPKSLVAKYLNLEGEEVTEKLEGLSARVFLHEFDHLKGLCFTDRISRLTLDIARRKLIKAQKRGKK